MEEQPRQPVSETTSSATPPESESLTTTSLTSSNVAPTQPPITSSAPLSTSEPSLRFPRPTVNRQLASWISSSQPDIMSPSSHPVEDVSLSESTYEFITTDDESQDGIATESLQSFGDARPEDVRSLAGSEQSESGIDTDSESEEESEEEVEQEEQNEEDTRSQASSIQYTEETLNSPSPRLPSHSDVLSLDEETVHLSVESTTKAGCSSPGRQQSNLSSFFLDLGSAGGTNIPMAARDSQADNRKQHDGRPAKAKKLPLELAQRAQTAWQDLDGALVRQYTTIALLVVLAGMGIEYLRGHVFLQQSSAAPAEVLSITPTAVVTTSVETTILINLTSPTSSPLQIPRANSVPSNSAVIPFSNLLPDIVPDAAKVPVCSASVHSSNEILVKMPLATKTIWLAKDSITIDVLRDGLAVKTRFSSIDEGLLIEIPYREAHGIICVRVVTTRRPRVNETFEVDFGNTILGHALDLADLLRDKISETTSDLSVHVNAAKDSISSGVMDRSGWLGSEVFSAANYLKKHIWNEMVVTKQWNQVRHSVRHAREQLQDNADLMQLNVLRAQIASRLWWLKMQFKTDEHDEYRRKAEAFLVQKYAEMMHAMQERRQTIEANKCQPATGFWGRRRYALPTK